MHTSLVFIQWQLSECSSKNYLRRDIVRSCINREITEKNRVTLRSNLISNLRIHLPRFRLPTNGRRLYKYNRGAFSFAIEDVSINFLQSLST